MSILELRDVSVRYPGRNSGEAIPALDSVNLTIQDWEFVVALGPSGCGKTTLLNLIAGFLSPSAGEILYRQSRDPEQTLAEESHAPGQRPAKAITLAHASAD